MFAPTFLYKTFPISLIAIEIFLANGKHHLAFDIWFFSRRWLNSVIAFSTRVNKAQGGKFFSEGSSSEKDCVQSNERVRKKSYILFFSPLELSLS